MSEKEIQAMQVKLTESKLNSKQALEEANERYEAQRIQHEEALKISHNQLEESKQALVTAFQDKDADHSEIQQQIATKEIKLTELTTQLTSLQAAKDEKEAQHEKLVE